MADDEKQIEIKKRARRRLVGAAALALLAVIVLPMVMDSELHPVEQDIQVRIPPQSGQNAVESAIEEVAVSSQSQAVSRNGSETPAAAAASPAPAVEGGEPAATAGEAPRAAASAPKAAPLDEGLRAAAILAGKSPNTLSGEIAAFVVQLGAYRDRNNAISLQSKLKSDGFSSYTEKVGDKTRVRIGPFVDRAEAEAVLARVKRLGLSGSVMPRD